MQTFRKRLAIWAKALTILSAVGLLLPGLSRVLTSLQDPFWLPVQWAVDLACHWQWLALSLLMLACSLQFWTNRNWRHLLWFMALPLPWLTAMPQLPMASTPQPSLTLVSANLHLDNTDAAPLLAWLNQSQPDLVLLLELSPEYAEQLKHATEYRYQLLQPQYNPFGIGLLSRYPLRQVEPLIDANGILHLRAQVDWPQQAFQITGLHPMPPIRAKDHQVRNQLLQQVSQASTLPAIMFGDFNASPWSSALITPRQAGFRRATSLESTWPSRGLGPLGLALDQLLASPDWQLVESRRGPDLGSDHWPIWVRLQPASVKPLAQ